MPVSETRTPRIANVTGPKKDGSQGRWVVRWREEHADGTSKPRAKTFSWGKDKAAARARAQDKADELKGEIAAVRAAISSAVAAPVSAEEGDEAWWNAEHIFYAKNIRAAANAGDADAVDMWCKAASAFRGVAQSQHGRKDIKRLEATLERLEKREAERRRARKRGTRVSAGGSGRQTRSGTVRRVDSIH